VLCNADNAHALRLDSGGVRYAVYKILPDRRCKVADSDID
jgi:hypothetical protein